MSILVDQDTRTLIQGIAGRGIAHVDRMMACGTRIVAGVAFGQGGTWLASVPVFDTVEEAIRATDANASLICVRAGEAPEAILEAASSGVELIICTTPDVPLHDLMLVKAWLADSQVRLVGPGSPGVFSPGRGMAGVIPEHIVRPGSVGVVSRSGSLAYEVAWQLTQAGLGLSTLLGIGGGPIVGTGFVDVLSMFEDDPLTEQIVIVGEIGGQEEEQAAAFVVDQVTKPVVAYVTGHTVPPGRRMEHAGAIIEEFSGTAQSKVDVLEEAGVRVACCPAAIPSLLERR